MYQIFTSSDCSSTLFFYTEWERDNHFWCSHWHQFLFRYVGVYLYVEGRVPCVLWGARVQSVKLMYRRENEELAKTNLESMDKTMQKLQHIGSIKDLRPQRDSVGVRSFGSGLKSECADNFSSEPDLWFALRDFVPGPRLSFVQSKYWANKFVYCIYLGSFQWLSFLIRVNKLIVFNFSVLGVLAGACARLVGTQRWFQRFVP